jgi:hypothetical protein
MEDGQLWRIPRTGLELRKQNGGLVLQGPLKNEEQEGELEGLIIHCKQAKIPLRARIQIPVHHG